jgi:hypothetical protein
MDMVLVNISLFQIVIYFTGVALIRPLPGLFQAANQPIKIVIAVEFNFNLPFWAILFNQDFSAEVTGKILGEAG